MLHNNWLIPLSLIAFSAAWLVQRPMTTGFYMLAVIGLLSPYYIDGTQTADAVMNHLFWNTVAIMLGARFGDHLVTVWRMPHFVQERDIYIDRQIGVRAALLMASMVGSALCWALIPVRWLNWTMALLVYDAVILVGGCTFRTGHKQSVPLLDVITAHFWLLVFSTVLHVALGVAESLCSADQVPVILLGTYGGLTCLLSLLNSGLLPNAAPEPKLIETADEELTGHALDSMTRDHAHEALDRLEAQ